MSVDQRIGEDMFNLVCGKKIGGGVHRDVFECKLNRSLVVKVEYELDYRYFANVLEMKFWNYHSEYEPVRKWLAPCRFLSPDGRILLQERVEPVRKSDNLPAQLPAFLSDRKIQNFGWLNGKLVCTDYASPITAVSVKPNKSNWWSEGDDWVA